MPPAPLPISEEQRLAALRSYDVLDSVCESAFDNLAGLAAQLTGSPIAFVSLTDAERQWFKARHGLPVVEVPREHSFCAWAILEPEKTLVVPDTRLDERFADNPLVLGSPDIRFYAGAPLVNRDGAALGTLCVLDQRPRGMSEGERQMLERLAEAVMTTLELRRAMAEIHRMAMADGLTGLANRPALLNAIDKAIAQQHRDGGRLGLLYFDLDGFKAVNDRQGHATGDAVLREVGKALNASLRDSDLGARLGGDEFAAVLHGDGLDTEAVAERLRQTLISAMEAKGWAVTASIGAATFHAPPSSVDEALTAADALMYGAKAAGKNRVLHRDYNSAATTSGPANA
ncbi:sensor domain-containing diguanylate cyclase [Acetobacteraceae bacterium H6797]|nr:sensor domain-containing diguanylate cyclase [Acetobacteraceae bacterium H6797]